ncbi:hypothetical protein BX600DRAFT_467315 [Xylariales sp. PMI_506]|nr:hypothetical protein BX600DRAFT_467315 [Xylariales sp. PMI_506]
MTWSSIQRPLLLTAGLVAGVLGGLTLDPKHYPAEDVITRDVAIIGGGSSGVYAAIRLQDYNHSVVVVERNDYLGGHAQTYTDPENDWTIDYGVIVFSNISVVTDYFARFDVPLTKFAASTANKEYVDFTTGEVDANFTTPNSTLIGAALQGFAAQLAKYPGINVGFNLTYPVPSDLLISWEDFLAKYNLQPITYLSWQIHQGMIPFLKMPTLYVMKSFNTFDLGSIISGFLTTANHNVGELYEKAGQQLGSDALLSSNVLAMDRSSSPVKVLVSTPSGNKLILANKLLSSVPPLIDNLSGFDLSDNETSVFSEFFSNGYYSGILNNTGVTETWNAVDPNQAAGVPSGGPYQFANNAGANLTQVYIATESPIPLSEVKSDVEAALQRTQAAQGLPVTTPEWLALGDHAPFNLMVSNSSIQDGFYERLYALQGERNTFYTGAAWTTQSSTVLWTFSEEYLLPILLPSL